jgi:hypothetical protein
MNTKKRKPLGSAMKELVFGTKEALPPSTPPFVVSPSALAAFPTAETSRHRQHCSLYCSRYATSAGEASAAEPIPVQSKQLSMTSKLQALDKKATVRFTVDMSETLHRPNGENEND